MTLSDLTATGPAQRNAVPTARVTVRYFAAACAAADTEEERVSVPAPATVSAVLAEVGTRHDRRLGEVLSRCSFLLDGVAVRSPDSPVPDGAMLDVLPPFAGG